MGWANVSALYSLFGTIFCILDNQFMIKVPLTSAYFEAEFSIRQPMPKQIIGLYIKQNDENKVHRYLESEGGPLTRGPISMLGALSPTEVITLAKS